MSDRVIQSAPAPVDDDDAVVLGEPDEITPTMRAMTRAAFPAAVDDEREREIREVYATVPSVFAIHDGRKAVRDLLALLDAARARIADLELAVRYESDVAEQARGALDAARAERDRLLEAGKLLFADIRPLDVSEPGHRMIPTQHRVGDIRQLRAAIAAVEEETHE